MMNNGKFEEGKPWSSIEFHEPFSPGQPFLHMVPTQLSGVLRSLIIQAEQRKKARNITGNSIKKRT